MRRTLLLPLALALAAAGCAEEAGAPDRSAAEQRLREAVAAHDRALVTANAAALNDLYADDYTYVTAAGEVRDKTSQIARLTSGQLEIMSAGSEEVTIRWIGDEALVVGRFPARLRIDGRESRIDERYSAWWSRDGGRWRLRHGHASLIPGSREARPPPE